MESAGANAALRADRPAEQVVTLVDEGPPIEGQIVDLEGRPVAGATVQAARIWYDEHGNIAAWIAKARNGAAGNLWQGLQNLTLDSKSTGKMAALQASDWSRSPPRLGADGRFKLAGIGRDRIAELISPGRESPRHRFMCSAGPSRRSAAPIGA